MMAIGRATPAASRELAANITPQPVADTGPSGVAAVAASSRAASRSAQPAMRRRLTAAHAGFTAAVMAVCLGWWLPTERILSPERGLGYALGICGGSAMLLLLLYPARKRVRWLGMLGSVKVWFQAHMVLGLLGPILILYHCNFSLGATNSNTALVAMLMVSGSGLVGRYLYIRIHLGLDGRRSSRAELQKAAEELRQKVAGSTLVPGLLDALQAAEQRMVSPVRLPFAILLCPLFVSTRMLIERRRLERLASRQLRAAAATNRVIARQRAVFESAVRRYIRRRLEATRRVVEFESLERLFSLWHVLHLPLFLMLLLAGVVHVVAVHVY